ncbi:hypothetical protein ACOME3_010528 [Neoechinorhynchus agilis]
MCGECGVQPADTVLSARAHLTQCMKRSKQKKQGVRSQAGMPLAKTRGDPYKRAGPGCAKHRGRLRLGLGPLMEGIELGESSPASDSSELFREAVLRHILVSSAYAEATQCSGYLHITLGMGERFVNPPLLRDYNCSQGNVVPRVASELCRRAG